MKTPTLHTAYAFALILLMACQGTSQTNESVSDQPDRIPVIIDTDANNELDDQHAMAYLFFNDDVFDVLGVTVNATYNGGTIDDQVAEAERVMKLCDVYGDIPLFKGAQDNFPIISRFITQDDYDGYEAVEFIINTARQSRSQRLVLLPVGKLTNIALALEIAPDIKDRVRIVWLGSNYPDPGEYNQDNDEWALHKILNEEVPFEMVTVRYGKPSGSDAVRATPEEINSNMPGGGPEVPPVEGRHGGEFTNFGDYSANLFSKIDLYGDPPSRALFDMVAVAILKNPSWGEANEIPAPKLVFPDSSYWQDQPENPRKIVIWENFDSDAITKDFYAVMQSK